MNTTRLSLSFLTAAIVSACGGGGGGDASPVTAPAPAPVAAAPVPTPTSTPTAALAGSQADGQTAINEINAALAASQAASRGAGISAPLKQTNSASKYRYRSKELTAATETVNCSELAAGGTGSATLTYPDTDDITSGYTISFNFNNCFLGAGEGTYNGTFRLVFDRYVSETDYTFTYSYINFNISNLTGLTGSQTVNGSSSCTVLGSNVSCYYNDGARAWSTSLSYNNGVVNGTYATNYGTAGSVQVTFTNYSATSGTAVMRGSNGTYTIRRCGANAYRITWAPTTGTGSTYSYGGGCP
jgi:hypothetical protein